MGILAAACLVPVAVSRIAFLVYQLGFGQAAVHCVFTGGNTPSLVMCVFIGGAAFSLWTIPLMLLILLVWTVTEIGRLVRNMIS